MGVNKGLDERELLITTLHSLRKMAKRPEPEPYAKYRLQHFDYKNNLDRSKPGQKHDYEDVKVRPSLHTTVTFGDGLKSPSDLFGSLKKAGQRFVGADKLVGSFNGLQKLSRISNHKSKCQCRHHQKRLLAETGKQLSDITESEHNVEG